MGRIVRRKRLKSSWRKGMRIWTSLLFPRRPRSAGQDAKPEPHVCPAPHANSDPNIRYYISSETWVICRMLDTEHPILHIFTRQPTAPNFDLSPSPLESSPLSD